MARMLSAYWPGSSLPAGKLKRPLSSVATLVVMVEPTFLALTTTPSIRPSLAEDTVPDSMEFCAGAAVDIKTANRTKPAMSGMRCMIVSPDKSDRARLSRRLGDFFKHRPRGGAAATAGSGHSAVCAAEKDRKFRHPSLGAAWVPQHDCAQETGRNHARAGRDRRGRTGRADAVASAVSRRHLQHHRRRQEPRL